jgi:hypothetical protein
LKLKEFLVGLGFLPSDADPGLFVLDTKDGVVFIVVYVDDKFFAANNIRW